MYAPAGIVILMLATLAASGTAGGAEPAPRETVTSRNRPELAPPGVRAGVFRLEPTAEVGYVRHDNVFATDTGEEEDTIFLLHPELRLESGWSRHSLVLGGEGTVARYQDFDDEDYEDWRIHGDGRLDLAAGEITLRLSHDDLHEARTSPDDVGGIEPTTFTLDTVAIAWVHRPGRLSFRPDIRVTRIDFDATPAASGQVDNSDRDRDVQSAGLRIAYALADTYGVFVEGRTTAVDYDRRIDFEGFERSSDARDLVVGTTLDLGGKTFGELYAGYRHWSYDDPRFRSIDGATFGIDLTWNPSGLTTLVASGGRTVESTTIVGAAGIERTAFGLTVDHELLRNLILSARLATATEDFAGIDRSDDLQEAGFRASYLLNRRLYLHAGIEHEQRDTSGIQSNGQEYDLSLLYVRLQGNL